MDINGRADKIRLAVAVGLLSATGAILCYLWVSGELGIIIDRLFEIFKGREELRNYVEQWGTWAPLGFILIQALQVVIAPIPGEFTGAVGGFIFGAVPNVIYSTIGLTLGSVGAFLAARLMGLPLIKIVVSRQTFDKFHFLTERRGVFLATALFIIPGFPKDILCYILGLSPMSFLVFTTVCALGRIPGTILLSFSGAAVYDQDWGLLALISIACLILISFFYFFRDRVETWLKVHKACKP
jgi:uncharacterized membrane protein YdjX (TVP38/TMEM64 family)